MPTPKEQAMKCLAFRREENSKKPKVNNDELQAGSPMFYYCDGCNETQVLPETHFASEIKSFCDECQELIKDGYATAEELRAGNR